MDTAGYKDIFLKFATEFENLSNLLCAHYIIMTRPNLPVSCDLQQGTRFGNMIVPVRKEDTLLSQNELDLLSSFIDQFGSSESLTAQLLNNPTLFDDIAAYDHFWLYKIGLVCSYISLSSKHLAAHGPHSDQLVYKFAKAQTELTQTADSLVRFWKPGKLKSLSAKARGKIGGGKSKKLKGIMDAVKKILNNNPKLSAEKIWRYFEDNHNGSNNALKINGFRVYFTNTKKGEFYEQLHQAEPGNPRKSITQSAFAGYVKDAKNNS